MAKTTDRQVVNGETYFIKDTEAREAISGEENARINGINDLTTIISRIDTGNFNQYFCHNMAENLRFYKEKSYAYTDAGGNIRISSNDSYNIWVLKVRATKYVFSSEIRFLVPCDENYQAVSSVIEQATEFDNRTVQADYLMFTLTYGYNHTRTSTLWIAEGSEAIKEALVYPPWVDNIIKNKAPMLDGFSYGNKFKQAFLVKENAYAYAAMNNTFLGMDENISYNIYCVQAEKGIYSFSKAIRTLATLDQKCRLLDYTENTSTYNNSSGNAAWLVMSVYKGIPPVITLNNITDDQYPAWFAEIINSIGPGGSSGGYPGYFERYSGAYSGKIALTNVKSSLSSDVEYMFNCNIESFTAGANVTICLVNANGDEYEQKLIITPTDYTYIGKIFGTPSDPVTEAHGLTIENDLHVHMTYKRNNSVKFVISSNGETFTKTLGITKGGVTYPTLEISGTTVDYCVFSWGSPEVVKDVWCFGDSYFSAGDPARWPYYLNRDEYFNNVLFDNFSGESSGSSIMSIRNLLKVATPKVVFWALGMNDGSDTNDTPSPAWKTRIDELVTMCENRGIKLILATVPTVPSINNESKNAWVRNSGYRYVNFAKAVNADPSGTWSEGMLSQDGVHPTATGAQALYYQVLSDLPEVMY